MTYNTHQAPAIRLTPRHLWRIAISSGSMIAVWPATTQKTQAGSKLKDPSRDMTHNLIIKKIADAMQWSGEVYCLQRNAKRTKRRIEACRMLKISNYEAKAVKLIHRPPQLCTSLSPMNTLLTKKVSTERDQLQRCTRPQKYPRTHKLFLKPNRNRW